MKFCALLVLTVLAVPAVASPVHVALKSAAVVTPNADGFFTLASVADLSGGAASLRTRLGLVSVGRAPLSGETRELTRGDLALKLRQAGCDPDKDASLEGAGETCVTTASESGLPASNNAGNLTPTLSLERRGSREATGEVSLLHPGSPVTILIQSGALVITAPGIARESGGAGDTIRVHRDGVMTDLIVTVLDAQTVRLEI